MDPFTTHGNIVADIRKGAFSNNIALQSLDFQADAHKNLAAIFPNRLVNGWYTANFPSSSFAFVNKTGVTQFRLRFQRDDDNDGISDLLRFFSGDYFNVNLRPTLIIEYYVP